jgi:hypothetical protein
LFEIDTIKPTASLVIATDATIGQLFPVILVATDTLVLTPNIQLSMLLRTGVVATASYPFSSSLAGVTWSGLVQIHTNCQYNRVATFNVLGYYEDDGGKHQ